MSFVQYSHTYTQYTVLSRISATGIRRRLDVAREIGRPRLHHLAIPEARTVEQRVMYAPVCHHGNALLRVGRLPRHEATNWPKVALEPQNYEVFGRAPPRETRVHMLAWVTTAAT